MKAKVPALAAVSELIRGQEMWIEVTAELRYRVKGPSLLVQLRDAIPVGNALSGTSGVAGSRPPLSTDALDLWHEIERVTFGAARHLGLSLADPGGQSPVPWVGRLLRQCVGHAHGRGQVELVDRLQDKCVEWTRRISGMLAPAPAHTQRGVRKVRCPEEACARQWVWEIREGEVFKVPSIVLVTHESLRWLVCQACGWNMAASDGDTPELVAVFDRPPAQSA